MLVTDAPFSRATIDDYRRLAGDGVDAIRAAADGCAAETRVSRREFGRRGRETVAERFLFTRLLRQYLGWFHDLADSSL